MRRSDFDFELPPDLIAQHPLQQRSASRLLHVGADVADRRFADLPELLRAGDLLVFNDTRVIPARIVGVKPSGGRVEILLERILSERRILAQVGSSKPLRQEVPIELAGGAQARFVSRHEDLFELELTVPAADFFTKHGEMPLPPYIERAAEASDRERYQTVFAREPGAVAAPTAGLHFDPELLGRLHERGVRSAYLTLHVGAGTFQPVRVDDLSQHRMHSERVSIGASVCERIGETHGAGGRVIAVGTTVVRSLESAARNGTLAPFEGETDIFITPGFRFQVIDALITNFHLPESTLLMLVCAFGGYERVMAAYRHAVSARYRFFSYGDAMFLESSS